jgi:lipoate-protein ligase A
LEIDHSLWYLWRDGAHAAAANMAADEALLEFAHTTQTACLRIYDWSSNAVSIGCFQRHSILPDDREGVRRLSGGGLVEHGTDVTYTLVAPKGHPVETHDREHSYAWIHQAVALALSQFQVNANQASEKMARSVDRSTMACFTEPSRYDLLGDVGKLAGAAQRRTNLGVLHQGSIQPPADVPADQLANALPCAFATIFACSWRTFSPDDDFNARIAELTDTRYATNAWRERR